MPGTIDQLIVNGPYEEPAEHWRYDRESRTFSLEAGRRPAGYVVATPGSKSFDDPGIVMPLPLVNKIRPRVKAWREAGDPGVTGTTRRLLEHWHDPDGWEYTGRPWADTGRSHINRCVLDSTWEASEAFALDRHPDVEAWARNDHLGFEIVYLFDGVVRKYRPDFDEWTRAVTQHGGFGRWTWAVSRAPSDPADVLRAAMA